MASGRGGPSKIEWVCMRKTCKFIKKDFKASGPARIKTCMDVWGLLGEGLGEPNAERGEGNRWFLFSYF